MRFLAIIASFLFAMETAALLHGTPSIKRGDHQGLARHLIPREGCDTALLEEYAACGGAFIEALTDPLADAACIAAYEEAETACASATGAAATK